MPSEDFVFSPTCSGSRVVDAQKCLPSALHALLAAIPALIIQSLVQSAILQFCKVQARYAMTISWI